MQTYLSQHEKYVFHFPGIGFKSYNGSDWTDVSLTDIKGRNKILVTYGDPSKINEELRKEKMKILNKSNSLDSYLFGLAIAGFVIFRYTTNPLGFLGLISFFLNKLFFKLYGKRIKKINISNHFKQFKIEPHLRDIYTLFSSEVDHKKGALNVIEFVRQKNMDLVAELYEKKYLQ